MMETPHYDADVIVVGAGAIGVSTARHLALEGLQVSVVEKEAGPGLHQSGRNSGVIHAGYNPKPGTEKARYCIEGNSQLREYCSTRGIPITIGGILVVASVESEIPTLLELERRALANNVEVEMLDNSDLHRVEPHATGVSALQAKEAGSFDARAYVHNMEAEAINAGSRFFYDQQVLGMEEKGKGVVVRTAKQTLRSRVAVNAAGLYADEIAGELAEAKGLRVIPFRGYYAELVPERSRLVQSHIYRAPDLNFPFLGVHLSRRADGRVIIGPGAMLAFGREAYSLASFEGGGLRRTLGWGGFWKMINRPEIRELIRSEVSKSLSLKPIWQEARELVPELELQDLVRSFAGNRAQMVDRNGNLVDDIVVEETDRTVHVLNAVSPGLTCSLPFGRDLAQQAMQKL